MLASSYPLLSASGGITAEHAMVCDSGSSLRLLIVPALFGEANRMRRFTLQVMRRLQCAGVDSFLPDLPGCNESLQSLSCQDTHTWARAMESAALHFSASHVLGIRGGGLFLPEGLPGWRYAPINGASQLRQMLRTRIIASREAGVRETQEDLLAKGLSDGLDLSGYTLSSSFLAAFQSLVPKVSTALSDIAQDQLGGSGLWLLAEPGEDDVQADTLAALVALGMRA